MEGDHELVPDGILLIVGSILEYGIFYNLLEYKLKHLAIHTYLQTITQNDQLISGNVFTRRLWGGGSLVSGTIRRPFYTSASPNDFCDLGVTRASFHGPGSIGETQSANAALSYREAMMPAGCVPFEPGGTFALP